MSWKYNVVEHASGCFDSIIFFYEELSNLRAKKILCDPKWIQNYNLTFLQGASKPSSKAVVLLFPYFEPQSLKIWEKNGQNVDTSINSNSNLSRRLNAPWF
jgi:hypothetical protein